MRRTSASDILLFELCPRKWYLSKNGHKEKKQLLAFYRFSSALHHACQIYLNELEDPILCFHDYWARYHDPYPLVYRNGETWDSLDVLGENLMRKFRNQFESQGIEVILVERKLSLRGNLWEYVGKPDVVGKRVNYVDIDFKTTDTLIPQIWVKHSDQMTGFAMLTAHEFMGQPPIDILVCNFIKETGNIQWIWDVRTAEDILEYQKKITYRVNEMESGYYPRRILYPFNSPCSWCEFTKECCIPKEKKSLASELEAFAM